MYFDVVPTKIADQKGVKSVQVRTTGSEKHHNTVALACTAASDMLPQMIIFKGKRLLKLTSPPGYVIANQEKVNGRAAHDQVDQGNI